MVKRVTLLLAALAALGLALPGAASAAEAVVSAVTSCGHCPFGCC